MDWTRCPIYTNWRLLQLSHSVTCNALSLNHKYEFYCLKGKTTNIRKGFAPVRNSRCCGCAFRRSAIIIYLDLQLQNAFHFESTIRKILWHRTSSPLLCSLESSYCWVYIVLVVKMSHACYQRHSKCPIRFIIQCSFDYLLLHSADSEHTEQFGWIDEWFTINDIYLSVLQHFH